MGEGGSIGWDWKKIEEVFPQSTQGTQGGRIEEVFPQSTQRRRGGGGLRRFSRRARRGAEGEED